MLIDYVSMFRTQYPNVKINIVTGNSEELLKRLEQREIDVALLLRSGNSEQYQMKILKKQPFVCDYSNKLGNIVFITACDD